MSEITLTIKIMTRANQQGTPYRDVYVSGSGLGALNGMCAGLIRQEGETRWRIHSDREEPVYDSPEMAALALVGQLVQMVPDPSTPRLGNAL